MGERTPEGRFFGQRLDSPGQCIPRELSTSLSTVTTSTQIDLQSPFASSSPSSPSRRARRPLRSAQPQLQLQIGSPVSFYLDGRPIPYFGHLKAVAANGLYTVDLVGGGRMPGLEMVTPCKEEELLKAEQLKHRVNCSEDPWAEYDTRNK